MAWNRPGYDYCRFQWKSFLLTWRGLNIFGIVFWNVSENGKKYWRFLFDEKSWNAVFSRALSKERSDLSSQSVTAYVLMHLVGCLFVDSCWNSEISWDFKNSKTEMCFRAFWTTLEVKDTFFSPFQNGFLPPGTVVAGR